MFGIHYAPTLIVLTEKNVWNCVNIFSILGHLRYVLSKNSKSWVYLFRNYWPTLFEALNKKLPESADFSSRVSLRYLWLPYKISSYSVHSALSYRISKFQFSSSKWESLISCSSELSELSKLKFYMEARGTLRILWEKNPLILVTFLLMPQKV